MPDWDYEASRCVFGDLPGQLKRNKAVNRSQRMQNRENARFLEKYAVVCEECGERGKHWMPERPTTLQDMLDGTSPAGFWTCAKFYGPDGRRIEP